MDITTTFQAVKAFFDAQSALANAISIFTPILGVGIAAYKLIWPRFSKPVSSMRDWAMNRFGQEGFRLKRPVLSMLKIAIVDDKPDDFPIAYLRQCGYDLTVISTISLADASGLQAYDLIAMDITNVVVEDAARGGLELIRRVKHFPNSPVVIAVSGRRYDPTMTEFFRLADSHMKKPIKPADLESAIEKLLTDRCAPGQIAESMDKIILAAVGDQHKRLAIIRRLSKALKSEKSVAAGLDGDSAKALLLQSSRFIKFAKYYDVK
ncbi:response regulator transcription factor [Burkholderia gladioli]|uniref:response regulator transcription factor n=1 Tax=Burkholderia gladioli TaxID=28095 RepID=UPI00163FD4A2|nr:response regulator transcription factor [Burkholderia gladioli]